MRKEEEAEERHEGGNREKKGLDGMAGGETRFSRVDALFMLRAMGIYCFWYTCCIVICCLRHKLCKLKFVNQKALTKVMAMLG